MAYLRIHEPELVVVPAWASEVKMLPGRVWVKVHSRSKSVNGIILTDEAHMGASDTATVIASGVKNLEVGDVVFLHPEDGKRIEDFAVNGNVLEGDSAFVGIVAIKRGKAVRMPWDESIMGSFTEVIKPEGRNILLNLGEKRGKSDGGIILPDGYTDRDDTAVIEAIGSGVNPELGLEVGQRVVIERRGLLEIGTLGRNTAFILEDGIYAILPPEPECLNS